MCRVSFLVIYCVFTASSWASCLLEGLKVCGEACMELLEHEEKYSEQDFKMFNAPIDAVWAGYRSSSHIHSINRVAYAQGLFFRKVSETIQKASNLPPVLADIIASYYQGTPWSAVKVLINEQWDPAYIVCIPMAPRCNSRDILLSTYGDIRLAVLEFLRLNKMDITKFSGIKIRCAGYAEDWQGTKYTLDQQHARLPGVSVDHIFTVQEFTDDVDSKEKESKSSEDGERSQLLKQHADMVQVAFMMGNKPVCYMSQIELFMSPSVASVIGGPAPES